VQRSTSKKYGVLGAFDRYNLGDALFSEIAATFIKDPIYYSPLGGDLQNLGGPVSFQTKSVTTDIEGLFIAGGEVISASWFGAWASIHSSKTENLVKIYSRILPTKPLNNIVQVRAKSSWTSPYMLPKHLQSLSSAYISVGGLIEDILVKSEFNSTVKSLQAASYVSVRDLESHLQLKKYGIENFLAPDSVSILASRVNSIRRANRSEYILVQCSLAWIKEKKNFNLIADFLTYIEKVGIKCKFICAGNTAIHSNMAAYNILKKNIPHLELIEESSIDSFKAAMANTKVFIGTSLHGHIVATASCVPSIKLRGIPKLDRYLNTWSTRIMSLESSRQDFNHLLRNTIKSENLIEEESKYLSSLATANYYRAIKAI